MKNFIVAFAVSVVLLSCTTDQSKKLDVVGQINQNMIKNPSAAGGAGTNYYVCDDGDDANDGLTEETPWKSFDRGMRQFNRLDAGDAVLFCRGGVFNVTSTLRLFNRNCAASFPCIISDYYNYNTQVEDRRPHIISMHTGKLFDFEDGGSADHDEGYKVENLMLFGPGQDSGTAFFFYNDVDDVEINNIHIESFRRGLQNIGENERLALVDVSAANVADKVRGTFEGSVFTIESEVNKREAEVVIGSVEHNQYFVCDDGEDSNLGETPFEPLRSFTMAMSKFKSLKKGGSISFCRGGEFSFVSADRLYNPNCTASEPCSIDSYVSATKVSQEIPIIISTNGGTVFRFEDGGNADPDGGYIVRDLILKSKVAAKNYGVYVFNDVDDLTIDNLVIDGFYVGITLQGTNTLNEGADKHNERIVIKNSKIINNSGQGLLAGCSDCLIENNLFENNGYGKKVFNHNIYLSFSNDSNITVANNTLRKSAVVDGECSGVSMVMHGMASNIKVINNKVEEEVGRVGAGCWGISIDTGYSTREESFTDVIIAGNEVINVGNMAVGCSSCVNVLIENNRIFNSNTVFGVTNIRVPSRAEDTVKSENIIIRNNEMVNYGGVIGIDVALDIGIPVIERNQLYADPNSAICQKVNGEEYQDVGACVNMTIR